MSFSGLGAVDGPYDGLPVGDGVVASQSHGDDGARAHEGCQAGKEGHSIQVCVEVAALPRTQLQFLLLPQEGGVGNFSEISTDAGFYLRNSDDLSSYIFFNLNN